MPMSAMMRDAERHVLELVVRAIKLNIEEMLAWESVSEEDHLQQQDSLNHLLTMHKAIVCRRHITPGELDRYSKILEGADGL